MQIKELGRLNEKDYAAVDKEKEKEGKSVGLSAGIIIGQGETLYSPKHKNYPNNISIAD